jgi:cytochrome c oxidase subunit 1
MLEWTTPLVPVHGNWIGSIPEVHRWPYDYKNDGKGNDFIPQNVPVQSSEG